MLLKIPILEASFTPKLRQEFMIEITLTENDFKSFEKAMNDEMCKANQAF